MKCKHEVLQKVQNTGSVVCCKEMVPYRLGLRPGINKEIYRKNLFLG